MRASPALLERAKSLAELGATLRRAGQRRAARPLLAEALDLTGAGCGARPLADRAHAELAAAARPSATRTSPRRRMRSPLANCASRGWPPNGRD